MTDAAALPGTTLHGIRIKSASVAGAVLSFCFYLSLVRATNIGLFYPPDEFALASIDYRPQTLMNFILLAGMAGIALITNKYKFVTDIFSSAIYTVLLAAIFLSCALSVSPVESMKFLIAVIAISTPCLLYVLTYGSTALFRGLARFAIVMAFANLAYILAMPQYGIMVNRHEGNWRGLFEHKNVAGPFFAVAFFILLNSLKGSRLPVVFVKGAAMLISALIVMRSESATGLVALVLMGFFYVSMLFVYRLNSLRDRAIVVFVAVASLLLVAAFAGDAIGNEFFTATGKDATLTGRTGIWQAIFDLAANRPLYGYGPGMSERPSFMQQIQGDVGWEVKGTHNSYLDMLIGFGYPATCLIVFLLVRTWMASFSDKVTRLSTLRHYALASSLVLTVLTISMANAGALFSRSSFWIFILSGLAVLKTKAAEPALSAHPGPHEMPPSPYPVPQNAVGPLNSY